MPCDSTSRFVRPLVGLFVALTHPHATRVAEYPALFLVKKQGHTCVLFCRQVYGKETVFSRVLRDSIPRFVGPSVSHAFVKFDENWPFMESK